jgi:hypothetical protein
MNPDVSIVGYGVRLRAAAGAELGRAPANDDSLIGAWAGAGQLHNCLVAIRNGVAKVAPTSSGRIDGFALEPDGTCRAAGWSIELPRFSCAWPRGLVLRVLPHRRNRWEFEFAGGREGIVILRGPLRASEVPPPPSLVGEGQELVRSDMRPHAMRIETRYEHAGAKWRQRHRYAVPAPATVVLVTAQAPEGAHESLFAATDEIASSIRLIDG